MDKPASTIDIRRQTAPDTPALATILETAWRNGELAGHAQHEIDRWLAGMGDDLETTYVAVVEGQVAGFLGASWDAIVVAPEFRRRGVGTALVRTALVSHPDLELGLPPDNPGAEAFLRSVDFELDHLLRRLRLRPGVEHQAPVWPAGFTLQSYEEHHFNRYFELVNQAFSDHPTPLQVSESRMRSVHSRPDFDPSLVALISRQEDPFHLVAFSFLRTPREENGLLEGSIGMIGVDRAYRRLGLGRQLLRWGVERLRQSGCAEITLEVVDVNERALPLYESEGFAPTKSWPFWKHRAAIAKRTS